MINIFLIGYGKMGRMIEENVHHIDAQITGIYDKQIQGYNKPLDERDYHDIDVAIEFTNPDSAFTNIHNMLKRKIPVVSGTTGWFHRIEDLKKEFNCLEHTLIYGANFSIGMNTLYEIVETTARLIDEIKLYDTYGIEAHHRGKVDIPSGTAKVLSNILLNNLSDKEKAIYNLSAEPLKKEELSFSSIRAGDIVGYHEIGFDSDFDELKISHNAKSRKGFAIGALLAARYAINHKGFFDFKTIFREIFRKS